MHLKLINTSMATFFPIVLSVSFLLLLLLLAKLLFSSTSRKHKRKSYNLPPSPPSLPVLGHLHLVKSPRHRSLARLAARHGPLLLLRFGLRRVLLVSSLPLAEECFTENDIALAGRPALPSGRHLSNNHTTLSSATYGPRWRNLRRIASLEIFSSARLQAFSAARADEVKSLVQQLYKDWGSSSGSFLQVEMTQRLFDLMLNVMMGMIAGKRYCGEKAGDAEAARRFKEIVHDGFGLSGMSKLGDFVPGLRWADPYGLESKLMALKERRDVFLQALIEEEKRKENKCGGSDELGGGETDQKKTLIGVLLALQRADTEYYNDETIRGFMSTLLYAGTDTSALTIEWAMSLLLNNPRVLKKAQQEIKQALKPGKLLEESDVPSLPYLQCIVSETRRMYPAGPLLLPHESTERCTVGGYDVPRRTMLLVNAWAIHRDPELWEAPNEFRPERFEGDQGEASKKTTMPFGMGRRRCPGERLAMTVVGMALGSLLQCFEWEGVGGEPVDMWEGSGLTLPKAKPLEALCRPHPTMIDVLKQL